MALSSEALDVFPFGHCDTSRQPGARPVAIVAVGPNRRAPVWADGARYRRRAPRAGLGFIPVAIAVPAIMQGVGLAVGLFTNRVGGAQKVQATVVVNEGERLMQQNLAAYRNSPPNAATQAAALSNFDSLWQSILQGCGDPALGDAGRRCISERQRGGEWDYFERYRDPLEGSSVDSVSTVTPGAPGTQSQPPAAAGPLAGGLAPGVLLGLLGLGAAWLYMK